MANSREQSQYGRKRSNTAQSSFRAVPGFVPLKLGDSKVLNAWVHDVKDTPNVVFNQSMWPGVSEGDLLRVSITQDERPDSWFLLTVPKDEGCAKPQLQISVPRPIADTFGLRNHTDVNLTKVEPTLYSADYVEFIFQDQYLGRNDMWRLGKFLAGQCIYTNQEVSFIGGIAAKIQNIYIGNKKVPSAYMTSATKAVYRSLSAKITIFIQVCRELWEFAGDGERYNEKIVHSFLPALFAKWKDAGTNHTVTIVLISRVYYDESEIDYAAGPLRQDDKGNWYKDFFKVITDLEVLHEWKPTLVSLKNSFWDFQRDILLTHHYHRATQDSDVGVPSQVRLVGKISFAQDGPILEALNLGLNPTETHYIDRSLNLTGAATILISPGTGYFRVSKQLLRLTTTRMLDQGFLLDLVLLTKPPLHESPIFSFEGHDPDSRSEKESKMGQEKSFDPFMRDPLWGGDDELDKRSGRPRKTFWWEPFWISTTFWGKQMDLPFRQDRFIASAKMHEVQMLGLLEHDVLSTIEVPYLPERSDRPASPTDRTASSPNLTQTDADKFDLDTFALTSQYSAGSLNTDAQPLIPSLRSNAEKRGSQRHSTLARIATIEESPKKIHRELPPEGLAVTAVSAVTVTGLGTSPSQSSIRSARSDKSGPTTNKPVSHSGSLSKGTLASKLTPSWLFNPFRSGPSEPQTTPVSASATAQNSEKFAKAEKHLEDTSYRPVSPSAPIRMPVPGKPILAPSVQQIQPMSIKNKPTTRSSLSRTFEEETVVPNRASYLRRSPINTPPRDENLSSKRRSASSILGHSTSGSSPAIIITNPSRPTPAVSYVQTAMASRWQHISPLPLYKHDLKWKSTVTPACLPLTVEHFPSIAELESSYDVFSYEFIVDPTEMRSFLVKPPTVKGSPEELRRAWALVVMRGMAAVRLAQGFQFVIRSKVGPGEEDKISGLRRNKSFVAEDETIRRPAGATEVLISTTDPVYLSMSNEIHRISYTGEVINVKRYVRRMSTSRSFHYQCLIWPKLGGGYTELSTKFSSHGLGDYGWNRLDMLVAGYEHHFNESLRYWRTRFIVIPTTEPPQVITGPAGESLNYEEARILGIEKLAEHFTKLRWQPPDEKIVHPPVRFLPTTLDPAISVLDESLMDQLDQLHAAGPLRKKVKSEREISEMSLSSVTKAMREDDGVPIKFYQWHRNQYPNSFTGYDFVSWLLREFRDVSNRSQGAEWGIKLLEQGLIEHCRGHHGFLDGHYYYRLKGEYSIPMTPKYWFRKNNDEVNVHHHRPPRSSTSRKKRLLSQTMVIDVDPQKRSDQAESVILHHDIIHNPATVFHFELQWIGTTARCIEDQLRVWSRSIERYGLRLVEAYVTQISDIRERNPFQSCFPMRLALEPPVIPDLERRLPEVTQAKWYFEYALLQKFGFIVDVEAADVYPSQVDVVYSYRRSPYRHSQFVHRTGVAFIQVLGGAQGFLFLTNRLMAPGRMGAIMKSKENRPGIAADEIRIQMDEFCTDEQKLRDFYDEQLALLPPAPATALTEEPPPLTI